MMPLFSLMLDAGLAALLLAVLVYCGKLNRSIRALQDSRGEMAKLFAEFDQSVGAAQKSVLELKETARQTEEQLREKLDTANRLADDLAFMIERGNKTADQIESGLKGGKPRAPQPAHATEPKRTSAATVGANRTVDEPATKSGGMLNAAKAALRGAKEPLTQQRASLESVLEQIANRNNPDTKSGDSKPHSRIRSKAEQELFDSLKSGR